MSRKKIVAGNWKMNKTLPEAVSLVNDIINSTTNEAVTKIFFPPALFLNEINALIKGKKNFHTGSQNSSNIESGAFTGEISAAAIHSVGTEYVLVGHSERRTYFKEGPELLKQKINMALHHQLSPIYCIGEQLNEREANKHFAVIERQLEESIFHLSADEFSKCIIAYEPVWAIGTGKTATAEEAGEIHTFIRERIAHKYSAATAGSTSILYGGSCNAQNAKELFATPDIDGGLIGGASLKASDFVSIINSFA